MTEEKEVVEETVVEEVVAEGAMSELDIEAAVRSLLDRVDSQEKRIRAALDGVDVLREMITERETIEAEEPPKKDWWMRADWVRTGFTKQQLHWEDIIPRENDFFIYQNTPIKVFKGQVMTVPHCIATEIRTREAR